MTLYADGDMSAANPHANTQRDGNYSQGGKVGEGVLAQTDYEASL